MDRFQGHLRKMCVSWDVPVRYQLSLDDNPVISLNEHLGDKITINYLGKIHCIHCGRLTKKSFNQGYCFPCFRKLAACDSCIMKPENCHFAAGTCREEEWGLKYCMVRHVVYLANSSGVKVGITRGTQVPTRWMDQGAVQSLPVCSVATRYQSGLVEQLLRQKISDRTQWRVMLQHNVAHIDLQQIRDELFSTLAGEFSDIQNKFPIGEVSFISDGKMHEFIYPMDLLTAKISSITLDKQSEIQGRLFGIKGQYLIFDDGRVFNVRKHTGYEVQVLFE